MRCRRLAPVPLLIWACLAGGPAAAPAVRVTDLLDQYVAGEFDAAIGQLNDRTDFDDVLKQLQRDGRTWIDAATPQDQYRRRLAAATFALEAARLDVWHEWKWLQRVEGQPLTTLTWKPAPLLVEWGCALLREHGPPAPAERWWHLGAISVAERSEDPQFLVGDLNAGLGGAHAETGNTTVEIRHLDHASTRFPQEHRFALAEGIAREWSPDIAVRAKALAAFTALKDDVDLGGEATLRMGALTMRNGYAEASVAVFNSVERLTRDRYVVYLARFLKGQALEQLRRLPDAEAAYRGAAATIPGAQSASLAAATLLFARDRRAEAQQLAAAAVGSPREIADPWREYAHADDRFWPQIIERLRDEIHPSADSVTPDDRTSPITSNTANDDHTVAVDVTVRTGNSPLSGLSVDAFTLFDNGVRQRIDRVETTRVPLDVTLVLDLSGDQRGLRTGALDPMSVASNVNDRVQPVIRLLKPDDRLRVLGIDSYVRTLVPLQPVSSVRPLTTIQAGEGLSSLYDALVGTLLLPVDPSRRHVAIVTTKGRDTVSASAGDAVRYIAERSDVLLNVVLLERDLDTEESRFRLQCAGIAADATTDVIPDTATGLCWPTRRFWVPFDRRTLETVPVPDSTPIHRLLPAGQVLVNAAAATGGRLYQGGALTEQTPASVLRATLDELQQSYVLRYTPQGVTRGGWHTLSVGVPGSSNATVRARRGYTMSSPTPPAARPESGGTDTLPATFSEIVDAYTRGDYERASTALRNWKEPSDLIKRFDEGVNPWPASPRREAMLALEIAEAGLFARRPETFNEATMLLRRWHRLIRAPLEPDAYERYWLWTELSLLQGRLYPNAAEPFVQYALERFPDEPRFLLALAIVTDQQYPFLGASRSAAQWADGTPTTDHIERVTERYTAAMKAPETAVEARVRLAWFLYRAGKHDEALARLDEIKDDEPTNDRGMQYLHQLFRGHIQIALGKTTEAIASYGRAIDRWPTSQAARVGLMNALLRAGRRAEADALAERIQSAPPDQSDPWVIYWLGDYRVYPGALSTLREMIR